MPGASGALGFTEATSKVNLVGMAGLVRLLLYHRADLVIFKSAPAQGEAAPRGELPRERELCR